ncbi:MAG: hypothetical protein M3Y27_12680, partial [Acidobacteriota bacterium]|nr:hypothetical protein [Acidobacteriota bacterium]
MRRSIVFGGAAVALAFFAFNIARNRVPRAAAAAPPSPTAIRITFGEKQERETDYSGTVTLSEGRVIELIPWRFFGDDRVNGPSSWTLHTRRANMETQPDQPRPISTPGPNRSLVPKGISMVVDAPASSSATVQTRRATYTFRIGDLNSGRLLILEDGDVTVQAVPAPSRISPAGQGAEQDYPSLAITADGSVWTAWQTYQNGGDRIYASHSVASGWSAPEPLTPAGLDVYRTAVGQDSGKRVWVVWSQREGEAWDLMARMNDGRGWSGVRKLTQGGGPNFFHKLIRDRSGNLHLVWVGHQNGASHVMWSKLSGDQWSPAQEISGPSAWMPDAAADSKGNLYVAWDSYRTGNYDVFVRRIGADGGMGPIDQVTKSPRFQAHASVAVDGNDRVWLAWDESGANWGKDYARDDVWRGTTLYADRRPQVAVLENGKWSAPVADPLAAMPLVYHRFVESPKLICDGQGRIWMALRARVSTAMNRTDFWSNNGRWEMFLTAYEGDRWRPAAQLPNSSTRPDGAFELASGGSGIAAVWSNDNRVFPGAGGAPNQRHDEVEFARMDSGSAPPSPTFQAFSETPGTAAPVHLREAEDVRRARAYRMAVSGNELRILRGDFHRHTEISPDGAGDGSLEDYFRYMVDAARMDTGIVSDHNAGGQEYT